MSFAPLLGFSWVTGALIGSALGTGEPGRGVSSGRVAGAIIRGRWTAEPGDRVGQSFSTGRGCIRC